ncbi:MAG: spermidine/putrescine ABC transporter permease PotC, partial [Gammaproteobacteria bacterium]|nr:spermidine/putrescine ABC transporter permease PotC [Gammaproteobacteria bacterium]
MRRPEPLDYAGRWWMRSFLAAFFVMLYAPIVTLVAFSFNDSKRNIVWRGFTTKYYAKAAANESLIEAFANSLTIAAVNMVASVALGVAAAVLCWRFLFPVLPAHDGIISPPILILVICLAPRALVVF